MRVLITGGAGFIGSNLAEELLLQGVSVRVLDNFSTGRRENLKKFQKDIELVEGDIRDTHLVGKAVKDADTVFHQAALASVPRSIKDPRTTNDVNVNGTLILLSAAVGSKVRRFVFASSSSIYGDSPVQPKHEGMNPQPLSPYAVSKLAGEHYCSVFGRLYDLETVALRYFNVFGPRQDPDSQYAAVIPRFIKTAAAGNQPVIFGDGEQSRDFTYIKNVVDANILAAEKKLKSGFVFNCANQQSITINDLVLKIGEVMGKKIVPIHKRPRPGDVKHSLADISLARKNLGYEPEVGFDAGLKKTMEYFQKHG
jgi:UDP-glucose 4-epimerase